jgi:hypothetical protein
MAPLIALVAALGCAGWVLYVIAPSAGHPPPRALGYVLLGGLGGLAVALVGGGLAAGLGPLPLAAVALGLVIAALLPVARPWVIRVTRGPDRRWALEQAWRAVQPVRRVARPAPGDAAWARAILREVEDLRTPQTTEFIDLLQGSLRIKLGGEPGVDPGWLETHLEAAATRLFPAWRTWTDADQPASPSALPADPPARARRPGGS